jgi:transposase
MKADTLRPDRAAQAILGSEDGAEGRDAAVRAKASEVVICLDAFHRVKGTRRALVRTPADLTVDQRTTIAGLSSSGSGPSRAHPLNERLWASFAAKGHAGKALLAGWLPWEERSRSEPFAEPAMTIEHDRPLIPTTLEHELSNAKAEATNVHLRVLTRRAYGFQTPKALIAMAMPTRGGCCPDLPERS